MTIMQWNQNWRICSINGKNPQSVRFLRLNPSIRKPIHPPQIESPFLSLWTVVTGQVRYVEMLHVSDVSCVFIRNVSFAIKFVAIFGSYMTS